MNLTPILRARGPRSLREALGLSVCELARQLGVTPGRVSQWETPERNRRAVFHRRYRISDEARERLWQMARDCAPDLEWRITGARRWTVRAVARCVCGRRFIKQTHWHSKCKFCK